MEANSKLQPQELMIGNYVNWNGTDQPITIQKLYMLEDGRHSY